MEKKRLLVICHGFPPYYGGAEHVAWYLAREAARSGEWDVGVWTSDIGGRLPAEEESDGLHILRVPARKKEWTRHSAIELGRFYLSARRGAAAAMARFRPDYTLAHFSFPAGLLARHLRRQFGIPYDVVLHGSDVPGYQPERFGLVYPLLRQVVRRVWSDAAHVVAVSEELKDLALKTWPGGTIEVIGNGVDTERFHPREESGLRSEKLKVVIVAQLIERKGIQYFLEALVRLDDPIRQRVSVEVYGTGPYADTLKDRAQARGLSGTIQFRGLAPHDKIPELLRDADLFVLPSLQEGLPLALLEAMASGVAILATRAGGIPNVLTDGRNALLADPADAPALAAALARIVSDSELRARLRKAARESAMACGWNETWKRYATLCRRNGLDLPAGRQGPLLHDCGREA
ncbi:MAG: putative teichuronic acid biosynthesis glycosyltransferase TuaC [Verrucomicrobia bacterium ADurb.Bin345]|nr:MAG: putative teichuronic acid biosynthesis glycosyltransferase TuaC [Verrucomicrobia bacterium ADurb.Bin345]